MRLVLTVGAERIVGHSYNAGPHMLAPKRRSRRLLASGHGLCQGRLPAR